MRNPWGQRLLVWQRFFFKILFCRARLGVLFLVVAQFIERLMNQATTIIVFIINYTLSIELLLAVKGI